MNTQDLIKSIPKYLKKLQELGLCENTQLMSKWVTSKFESYCLNNSIEVIDRRVVKKFYEDLFTINIDNLKKGYDYTRVRPILALIDYHKNNNIKVAYNKIHNNRINNDNYDCLMKHYLNSNYALELSDSSIKRKERVVYLFLNYINTNGISNIKLLTKDIVINYMNVEYNKYNYSTKETYKCILREFLNDLFSSKQITFTGNKVLPQICCRGRKPIEDCYSPEEIKTILESIDNSDIAGKTKLLITVLAAYYGLRAGDIANLKYENIDWNNNVVSLIQQKTKKSLILPLIDEVKYPLIDYIKCSKHIVIDGNYILKSIHSPHRRICKQNVSNLLSGIIKKSGIDINKRRKGSRIFRHSLATNMINENISLEKIRTILGHTSKATTSLYVTTDKNNLSKLTLEVPNGKI